jgi:hypothetical protein
VLDWEVVVVRHHLVSSSTRTWDSLFAEVAARATELGPSRLAAISHGSDSSSGTVVVWERPADDGEPGPPRWMRYWFVRSSMRPWEALLDDAARFASGLRPGQLYGITHSADNSDGVVAVWFWVDTDPSERKRLRGSVSVAALPGGGLSEPEESS